MVSCQLFNFLDQYAGGCIKSYCVRCIFPITPFREENDIVSYAPLMYVGISQYSWNSDMRYLWGLFMKILAGVWYVGVFSDSQPSRFQSKMV